MKLRFTIFVAVLLQIQILYAQKIVREEPVDKESIATSQNMRNICHWPVPGSETLNYTAKLLSDVFSGEMAPMGLRNPDEKKQENALEQPDYSNWSGKFIHSEQEFKQAFGKTDSDIDWSRQKVFVYTTQTTYKFGTLEYTSEFTGMSVSIDGKTLFTGTLGTLHGGCQGIQQPEEWFAYHTQTYSAIIPKDTPETVRTIYCYAGPDCSDAP